MPSQIPGSFLPLPPFKAIKEESVHAPNGSGYNCKIILPIYNSLIRSILDYDSLIYDLAPPSHLGLSLTCAERRNPYI